MEKMVDLSFFCNKRVFLTGHTGFKGSWLTRILVDAGADVTGYSLAPADNQPLYEISGVDSKIHSIYGDIRDFDALYAAFSQCAPEIVMHLAAQPLVIDSYNAPRYTYEVNLMGTVNLLECMRKKGGVRSAVMVTTDKVYFNDETGRGYIEDDRLCGYDPYSNSKSCCELAVSSYKKSFFEGTDIAISTVRAGNVIGGGDFSANRIIPDCVRAAAAGEDIIIRHPEAVRPFQHVLEPLFAYLLVAQRQYEDKSVADCYNIGPDESGCVNAQALAELFCSAWSGAHYRCNEVANAVHEAGLLRLDCTKITKRLGWQPKWSVARAVEETVSWHRTLLEGGDMPALMQRQIAEYSNEADI